MSRKKNNLEINPAESKDQLITELIQQRKLQQGALLKIMDSIDKEEKEADSGTTQEEAPRRKRVFEKIFSTDKKNQK
jgi:hypothetical protein